MKRPIKKEFENYAKNYKRRKSWQRVVSMLTCIIVFCTTYALILPAITLAGEAACGCEEHVHTDGCYEVLTEQRLTCDPVHVHTADCYENGTLVCGRADYVLHTHNDSCFSESGEMLCSLRKLEEHTHSEACYTVEETVTGHLHSDDCYSVELGEIVCGLEEAEAHTHGEGCYGEATLSCTAGENDEHTHGEDCYTAERICGLEETEGHTHSDSCHEEIRTLICELEEDGVITEEQVLICTKPAVTAHTHTDSCYEITKDEDGEEIRVLICTELEVLEHQHSAECLVNVTTQGALTCAQQEHIHEEACFPEIIEEYSAPVFYEDGADIPVALNNGDIFDVSNPDAEVVIKTNPSFDPNSETYDISLKINWGLNNADLLQYDAFHVDIPDNLIIPDDLLNVRRRAADETLGGIVSFDYWFEKTADGKYVIHVEYLDSYKTEVKGQDIKSHIEFSGTVNKDAVNKDGEIVLKWSDGTETTIGPNQIQYPSNESLSYDLHTSKVGEYSSSNNKLTYTVKVYSDKGTANDITVSDTLNLNGVTVKGDPAISIVDQNGSTVSFTPTYERDSNNAKFSTTLPKLNAGGYYLITYTYDVEELPPGSQKWLNNTVKATSPNPESGKDMESSSSSSVKVSKNMLSKVGSFDSENNLITWTITVNQDQDNIAGYVLTDGMLQNALSLSIIPADTSSYELVRTDGKITAINFLPVTDTNADNTADSNTNTYTITYTTEEKETTAGGNTSNKAILTPPEESGQPSTDTGDVNVWVPGKGGIDKSYVSMDGNVLNWSVALTIPEGGIGAGTVLKDNTGYNWDAKHDNHWMTPAQITALKDSVAALFPGANYTLEFSSDGYNWDTYEKAIADTATSKYYCWRVTFNEDITSVANQTLTLNYSTTTDLSSVTSSVTFVNTAKLGDNYDTATKEYKPSVAKLDKNYQSGTSYVSNTDGIIGWYIRVNPDEDKSQIVVTDTLPEGLTVTKLGIGPDGSSAGSGSGYGSADKILTSWKDYQAAYTIDGQVVTVTITPSGSATSIPAGQDVYVYVECKINDLPSAGESKDYIFTNSAVVDGVTVTQTQNVKVSRPAMVQKTDRNGSTADSSSSYDGTVGWYVRVYLPEGATNLTEDPISIVDTLPDGLTVSKLGIGQTMHEARYGDRVLSTVAASGTVSGYNDIYKGDYTVADNTDGTKTVTVNVNNNGTDIAANSYIYLYIECTIDEDARKEETETQIKYTFNNSATVTIDGNPLGSDSQKQEIYETKEAGPSAVDKSSLWDGELNQLQYAVLINQQGADLSSDGDTILVEDVLGYHYNRWWETKSSTLIPSSVKLYYAKTDDAGNVLVDANGFPMTNGEVPKDLWSWTYSDNFDSVLAWQTDQVQQKITATVPDGTKLVLKYIYEFRIDADHTASFQVSNKATVTGSTTTSDDVSTSGQWQASDVSAGSSTTGTYTIYKVQQGNYNFTLPDAEFTIYKYADNTPLLDGSGNAVKRVTNDNGTVRVAWNDGIYEEDVVYYLMETRAPDGYFLPDDPPKFYFYFKNTGSGYTIPEGAVDLNAGFSNQYVENELDDMSVSVGKTWDGNAPEDITEIQFQLIRTDIHGNSEVYFVAPEGATEAQIAGQYYIITKDSSGNWQTVTIDHLQAEDLDGHPYTFTVQELNVPTGYVAEVTSESGDKHLSFNIHNKHMVTNDVSVRKDWSEDIAAADRKDIQVQLYQYVVKPVTKYTAYMYFAANDPNWWPQLSPEEAFQLKKDIEGAGSYELTWNLVDFGWDPVNDCIMFRLDIFDPLNNMSGWKISSATVTLTNKDGTTTTLDVDESKLKYSRATDRPEYYRIDISDVWGTEALDPTAIVFDKSIKLSFTLVDSNGNSSATLPDFSYIPTNVTTGGTAYGDPVTLNSTASWQYTWEDLPENGTDANGNLIQYGYYVQELTDGYKVSYSTATDGTLVITNEPLTSSGHVSIQVDKQWNTSKIPVDSVEFELYRQTQDVEEGTTVDMVLKHGYGYNDSNNNWVDDVVTYSTTAVSPDSSHYVTLIGAEGTAVWWTYSPNNDIKTELISSTAIGQMSSNGATLYEYKFKVTVNSDSEIVFNLKRSRGEVELTDGTKQVVGITKVENASESATAWTKVGSYSISSSDDWTTTIHDLEPGTYKIIETTTGFTTTYTVGETTTDDPAQITLTAGQTGEVTINNALESVSITINKQWLDDGQSRYNHGMLTFTLYQDGVAYSTGTLYMEQDTDGNYVWQTTITDLPKSHPKLDSDGNVVYEDGQLVYEDYVYTIKETPISGYLTEYSANNVASTSDYTSAGVTGSGTITIINEQVTDIGVKKFWANDSITKTDVIMELYQVAAHASNGATGPSTATTGGTLYKQVTLGENQDDGWDKTWRHLPLFEFDNGQITTYYSYYIVEQADGYTKTYSTDQAITSGRIDVTNDIETTDIGVNKVWTDGSITPVDVSLYQVFTPSATHVHAYTAVVTAPTCTAQGYTTRTCACGHVIVDSYTAATGHNWNSGTVEKEPTETETGIMLYTCYTCGATRRESINSLSHTHSYTSEVTTPATCTQQGVETFTCACGSSYTGYISPTGHSWGSDPNAQWQTTPATCTTDGVQTRTCTNGCGTTETRTIAALGHSWCTCSTQAQSGDCSYCVYTAPTADKNGSIVRTCMRDGCAETKTEDIPVISSSVTIFSGTGDSALTGGWPYSFASTDGTYEPLDFNLAGRFDFSYAPTNQYYHKIQLVVYYIDQWNQNSTYWIDLSGTVQSDGNYVATYSYSDILSKVGIDSFSKVTKFAVSGDNISVTKITWTPASTLSANSFNYTNRVYYAEGSSSNPLGGTLISTETVTPGTTKYWTDLPKYKLDENGNILGEYTYYVVETGGNEFDATYAYGSVTGESQMSQGITSGTITITNRNEYHYELPATGGMGTEPYTLGGIFLLMAGCAVLMYNKKKGRKGAHTP